VAGHRGAETPPAEKMLYGFWLIAVCTGLMSLAGSLSASGKVSVWFVMAAFLFARLFGDGVAAGYDQLWGVLSHGLYFGIQATIMVIASLLFGVVTSKERSIKGKERNHEEIHGGH
jgi:hypothetical protein